jgi:hypothetical protein
MLIKLYAVEVPQTHFCSLAPGLVESRIQDYLDALPEQLAETFPVLAKIRSARGTPTMPTPDAVAPLLLNCMQKALSHPSGAFLDIRTM